VILLGLLAAASVVHPEPARALSLDKAVVKFNPRKGDGFVLKGRLATLSVDGAETVAVAFGSFTEEVPQASFVRKGQKLIYKAPRARGIRTLLIDAAKQRFLVVGKGILLAPFHNPAAIRLSGGDASECTMIRLTETARQWRLDGAAGGGACVLEVPPQLTPSGFLVQRETVVRVLATVTPGAALDDDGATLVRVDSGLVPSGEALCTLRDDGAAAIDDVAGDGLFGCIASFNEAAPARIRLLVQATVGGTPALSPTATLDVATPLTDQEINVGIAGQELAGTAWDESFARFGDTAKARRATVARIKRIPGVTTAGIAADGYSIWIQYDSGVEGGLNLDPPGTPGTGPDVLSPPSAGTSGLRPAAAGIRRALPTVAPRIGNNKVLVWDPWADETAPDPPILATLRGSTCPPLEVTYLRNQECTIDSIRTFPEYGTIVLLTHGAVLLNGAVAFITREKATTFSEWVTYAEDLKLGRLLVNKSQRNPSKIDYLAFRPSFIANLPGRYPNSIVFAGACLSAANRSMADVFFTKGAKAYFGMSKLAYATFSRVTAEDVFGSLLRSQRNAFDAFTHLAHTTDRSLFAATGVSIAPLDTEVRLLVGDGRLAYACGPSGEELLDTLTVAVNGEQVGTATLRSDVTYRLVVTGTATESLKQGTNEFDAFYCFGGFCSVGPFGDSRLIGVGIIVDPGDDSPHVAISQAIDGPYPAFESSHRYDVTYRPPVSGRMALRSPHIASEGPFMTTGSFTIEVFGPR
jgi:hypothetical protein